MERKCDYPKCSNLGQVRQGNKSTGKSVRRRWCGFHYRGNGKIERMKFMKLLPRLTHMTTTQFGNGLLGLLGMAVYESKYAVEHIQDWSGCRSKARAMRRHAIGIKTRMVERDIPTAFMIGGKLHAHPEIISLIKKI